jgi:hypothetical protein
MCPSRPIPVTNVIAFRASSAIVAISVCLFSLTPHFFAASNAIQRNRDFDPSLYHLREVGVDQNKIYWRILQVIHHDGRGEIVCCCRTNWKLYCNFLAVLGWVLAGSREQFRANVRR